MAAHSEPSFLQKRREGFLAFLKDYGVQFYFSLFVFFYAFAVWVPHNIEEAKLVGLLVLIVAPFVLPIMLAKMWVIAWFDYARQAEYWSRDYTLFEIRLPEDITQGPQAAELFLKALYQTGEIDKPIDEWEGKTRPWFSLEIASIEGRVKFFVWTRTSYAEMVKAQMYAHYPTVQVVEVSDYTRLIPYGPDMGVWGVEQALQLPDPYPIMTYKAWGLEKNDTKEEFKHDPLNSVLEFYGSMGPGEYAWMQIIIRTHRKDVPCDWSHEKTHKDLDIEKWAKLEVDKLGSAYADKKDADGNPQISFMSMPDGYKEAVKVIQEKLSKQLFEVGIRNLYVYKKSHKQGRNAGFPTAMRSFEHGSEGRGLNGLKPMFYIGTFNYPWEDFLGMRRARLSKKLYDGYVERQYFYEPHKQYSIVLNTEEIATLWHLPGKVARTPTLERMPSRRSEAPANLPL